MEKSLMKKFLIWTALVLAAITACNKEIDTQLTSNTPDETKIEAKKVTLTIKASIEAETRTAYENDQKATWQVDDKITVCVTNSSHSDFLLYDLKAEIVNDELVFAGEVDENYTTVVSGIYPAQDNYHLDTPVENTNKKYFNIGVEGDGSVIGIYLPDEYDLLGKNDTGIAIPMVGKIENGAFTFRHICGALKIEIVDIFNTLTFTTAAETITGDFPLTNGGIEMPTEGTSSTITFNYNRLQSYSGSGPRQTRSFYIPVPYGTLSLGASLALKKANTVVYERTTSKGIEIESNVIRRMQPITFTTPSDWALDVREATRPIVYFNVPATTSWIRLMTTEESFNSTYKGSIEKFIEDKLAGNTICSIPDQRSYTLGKTTSELEESNAKYVLLMCGVTEDRKFTFEYCKLDYTFEKPEGDYSKWIGKWSFSNGSTTDTWTISRKNANHSYAVTGIAGSSGYYVKLDRNDHNGLTLSTQRLNEKYGTNNREVYFLARSNNGVFQTFGIPVMTLTMDDAEKVTVEYSSSNAPGGYGIYYYVTKYNTIANRDNSAESQYTMTRITE